VSTEVPLVRYHSDSGEREVIGKCVVEDDGTFTAIVDDEIMADMLTETNAAMSFSIVEDTKLEHKVPPTSAWIADYTPIKKKEDPT
jgi:hypothetical protein